MNYSEKFVPHLNWEDARALSPADYIPRIPANSARMALSHFHLFAAGVPRPFIASTRISVFASYNSGLRLDDQHQAAR